MTVVSMEDAQARLAELIDHQQQGEHVVITRDQQPVARLFAEGNNRGEPQKPHQPGSAKGILKILVEDDEHLVGFEAYMS